MQTTIAIALALLMIAGCSAEQQTAVPTEETSPSTATTVPSETVATGTEGVAETTAGTTAETATEPLANENQQAGTWSGQIKLGKPVSMFNYVGAESGDFAPMRFTNDSAAGKQILAACGDDDSCEFTGVVEWLDETPPQDASAIGKIVRVDSVKRVPDAP
jgi:hypothetical protein